MMRVSATLGNGETERQVVNQGKHATANGTGVAQLMPHCPSQGSSFASQDILLPHPTGRMDNLPIRALQGSFRNFSKLSIDDTSELKQRPARWQLT